MNNKGKCRLKLYRVRVYGALAFYCINPEHDHGEHHPFLKSLTAESIGVDPEALYAEMMSYTTAQGLAPRGDRTVGAS